jgi:hypothetical protein
MEEEIPHQTEARRDSVGHARPINTQTQIIVVVLGLLIFASGAMSSVAWRTIATDEGSTLAHVPSTPITPLPQSAPSATTTKEVARVKEVASGILDETLFSGTITGFYATYEQDVWDEVQTCHAFVVTEGPREIIDKYTRMIQDGNSVQRLDASKRLMVNLPWDSIPDKDQEAIRASTETDTVSLTLREQVPSYAGAGICHSFFSFDSLAE